MREQTPLSRILAMLKSIKTDYQVIIILGLVALYHLILQDRGAYSWPDEHLYNDALKSIASLTRLDLFGFCRDLTGFGARPAEATLRLVPAALQSLLEYWKGISPYNPESLRIPATFNVLSSFLLSFVFYRLSQLFFAGDKIAATLATLVYALLVSSNIFVRHIIPYDTALLFCLLSLYTALKGKGEGEGPVEIRRLVLAMAFCGTGLLLYPLSFLLSRSAALYGALFCLACALVSLWVVAGGNTHAETRRWVMAGLLGGFGLALYPAYYSFPGGVLLVILLTRDKSPFFGLSWSRLRAGMLFGLSVLSVVFFYEVISRVGDVSYLACAYRLSKTITQGEFAEGYVFLPKYFAEVEGVIGVLLLALALAWLVMVAVRLSRGETLARSQMALTLCCTIWAGFYLVYGTQSAVLHKMAFTGRYARMYFPFVVWAAIEALRQIPSLGLKRIAYGATAAASLYSFFGYAVTYRELAYPVNVLYAHGIRWEDVVSENKVWEAQRISQEWIVTMPPKGITGEVNYLTRPGDNRYVLVNFGFFSFDAPHPKAFNALPGAEVIYRKPHFLTFRASGFEGYTISQRNVAEAGKFQVCIYKHSDLL